MQKQALIKTVLLTTAFGICTPVWSDEVNRSSKAVQETSEALGFRLSDIARQTIEITTSPVTTQSPFTVRDQSLVHHQDKIGVYRLRDGWFKLIDVEVVQKNPTGLIVRTSDLRPGDELVVSGAALLRVTDLQAFSAGE